YDTQRDPQEKTNVLATERRTYAQMRDELARYTDKAALPTHVDPEEAKKLAALGYLSSTAPAAEGSLPDPKDRIGEISAMVAATRLLHERRLDDAIAAFQRIVQQNPRFTDAWNEFGSALEAAGRYQEAVDVYKKAIAAAPELADEFGLKIASALLHLERYDEAERNARLGERSNLGGTHLILARSALAQKKFAKAEEEARIGVRDTNNRLAAQILLAQIYAQQGRANEAMAALPNDGQDLESYHFARGDILA